MLLAIIGLPHMQLLHLRRKMIRSACIHIAGRISRKSRGMSLQSVHIIRHGEMMVKKTTIIVHAQEILLEPFEAARSDVARLITQMTDRGGTPAIIAASSTAVRACTIALVRTTTTSTRGGRGSTSRTRSIVGLRSRGVGAWRGWRGPRHRRPRHLATIASSVSLMRRGPAGLNELLCRKKTSIEIMRGHRIGAVSHKLDNGVIILIKAIKNKIIELLRTKWLTNRSQRVS
jgi:hypothetical protein